MASRTLDITVMYARDLKNVRRYKNMAVYAVVSISEDTQPERRTGADKDGGTNPTWNSFMQLTINESAAQQNLLTLEFRLQCERSLGDRDIGVVRVPVKELLDTIGDGKSPAQEVRRGVTTSSGTIQGELIFSYKFGEIFNGPTYQPPRQQQQPVSGFRRAKHAAGEAIVTTAVALGLGFAFDEASKDE